MDSQYLTRKALAALIRETPGFVLEKEHADPLNFLEASKEKSSLLFVIGIAADQENLIDLILSKCREGMEFLLLSDSCERETIDRLIKAGVKGIVTKHCSEQEIINALQAVAVGNRFYCNKVLTTIIEPEPAEREPLPELTRREQEVLNLIAEGKTTGEIANQLHISIHTVNSHRKNLVKKLKISSPLHLVAYAQEKGLVSINFK